MQCYGYNGDLVIITEDACGKPYCVQSKYIMDVLDDWRGAAMMCPANGPPPQTSSDSQYG